MRKVIAIEFISLDGVIQAPGGPEEGFAYGGPLLMTTMFKKPRCRSSCTCHLTR